jgi:hypothetical protein
VTRVGVLAAFYLGLGLALAAAGEVGAAWRAPVRWAVLFGLPLLVGALGVACVRRTVLRPPAPGRRTILLAALLVVLDLAPIGLGFLFHQLTFSYGDQGLAAGRLVAVLVGVPAVLTVTVWGWEKGLRERLAGGARAAGAAGWGSVLSVTSGVALSVVVFASGFEITDRSFAVAALGSALLRETTALRLYGAGGIVTSGLYRGLLAGIEGLLIADWASFWFPSATFVSSDPRFTWLRLAGSAAGLGVAWVLTRKSPAARA